MAVNTTPIITGAVYEDKGTGKRIVVTSAKASTVYFHTKRGSKVPVARETIPPKAFRRRFMLVERG